MSPDRPRRRTCRVGSRARASCTASAASTVRSTGPRSRGRWLSSRVKSSRSSTSPPIRMASPSMRRMVPATSSGSMTAPWRNSSAYPLTVARGVRSSCEASATNWRIRSSEASLTAKDCSIWASIALSERDRLVTSSLAVGSGMRRVRSPAAMAAAVSSIWESGRKARRTPYHPKMAQLALTPRPIRVETVNICWTVVSTPRSGTATEKVADPSRSWPGTTRQRISPSMDWTVKGVLFCTRGSFRPRDGMSGRSRSPVGFTSRGSPPSVGMNRTA